MKIMIDLKVYNEGTRRIYENWTKNI